MRMSLYTQCIRCLFLFRLILLFIPLEIIAVVKANAYGHGSVVISKFLQDQGCTHFAVATTGEGKELRDAGITGKVLVLGNATEYDIPSLHQNRLMPTVADINLLKQWKKYHDNNDNTGASCEVVIELDTGLMRNGCIAEALSDIVECCMERDIPIHSIMTHFCSCWNVSESKKQFEQFLEIVKPYTQRGIKVQAASSGPITNGIATHLDYVRAGFLIYGLGPAKVMERKIDYRQAMTWFAQPTMVKDLIAGTRIGYNNAYTCDVPQRVATLPLGFADGYPRKLSGKNCVTDQNGSLCQVVGLISMDAMTVKVGAKSTTSEVFCLLSDGVSNVNSCQSLATLLDTFLAEILVNIRPRVPRLYTFGTAIAKDDLPRSESENTEMQ